ncbi:pancreatic triacylglycerol lipase-like [Haliotis cracherodii]|uniref:pancreatic triacylglycerol lipase-like n=1 Tax=Haliotis cracherodii TaxID=6455 RepID=UPI0039ED085F
MDLSKITVILLCAFCPAQGWFFSVFKTRRVCYDGYKLGCFSAAAPYTNTNYLPRSPDSLGVKFKFFASPTIYHTLDLKYNLRRLQSRNVFRPDLPTKVIIHGFNDRGDNPWVKNMVKELLKKGSMNVVVVDWRKGASAFDYQQAVADIRVVGAMTARLLTKLQEQGADSATFHMIGHSLGAHVAGYAGRRNTDTGRVGRITGLDPAGPSFEDTNPTVRLDPTDAVFVDVIHTDTEPLTRMGMGIKQLSGHVDFYPNGGVDQPGCPAHIAHMLVTLLSGKSTFIGSFACSHMRAVYIFTESINSLCQFKATRCPSTKNITHNACTGCPETGCPRMGFYADSNKTPGIYFTSTHDKAPFCISSLVS